MTDPILLPTLDALDVKIDSITFNLGVCEHDGKYQFEYHTSSPPLRSAHPFRILQDVCEAYFPGANFKDRGWNSIRYQGQTLLWWRRHQLTNMVAEQVQALSPAITGVALATLLRRSRAPQASSTNSSPHEIASSSSTSTSDELAEPPWTKFIAYVASESDKSQLLANHPSLKVDVVAQKSRLEHQFVDDGSSRSVIGD